MKVHVNHPDTLLEVLKKEFSSASITRVKKMILHGCIWINGKPENNPSAKVQPADQIEYLKEQPLLKRVPFPFPILFEDTDLLVTIKPAGLLTYGERGTGGTSLYRILSGIIKERSGGKERLFVVHRLDREVSGIILFAKNEKIQQQMKENWQEVTKKYYALVEGRPPESSGTFRSYLAAIDRQRVRSVSHPSGAKSAVTHYRTLKELPDHTLLEVTLETGRKHQIRVHLSEAGCPVAGDRRYGAQTTTKRGIRLMAYFLAFTHPVSRKRLEFSHPIPQGWNPR